VRPDAPHVRAVELHRVRRAERRRQECDGTAVLGAPPDPQCTGVARPLLEDPEAFDDGAALWEAVCEHELEGVVAKQRSGRYLPGDRGWIKTKNRDYWRYEMEREGAFNSRRQRQLT
jgi:hypothetical protein